MKRKRMIQSVLVSVLALSLVLGGCANGGESSSEAGSAASTAAEKVELSLWTWSPIERTAKNMLAAFEKKNPNIKIDYTNYNYDPEYLAALSTGAAANNLPDIVGLQPGSLTQQYRDYLVPLQDYAVKTWGDSWTSKFYNIAASQIQLGNPSGDDNTYLMPIETQIINIYYNTAVFKQVGIDVPTTYDELKTAAQKLSAAGIAPMYQGGADSWQNINLYLMLVSQIDTKVFDQAQAGTVKWTDDKLVEAMTNWKKLFDDGIIQAGSLSAHSYPDGVNALTSGNAGMMALGSWWPQEYTADDAAQSIQDWTFDDFFLPAVENGLTASQPIGGIDFAYGITKDCKNADAAWTAVASFAAGEGIQACVNDLNDLPAFKGIEPEGDIPDTIKTQIKDYSAELDGCMNQRIGEPTVSTALGNALSGVASGELTPEAGMQAVQDAQDQLS